MHERALLPLADLDVLVIDCQATAAAPAGHLLELAWMRTRATPQAQHEQGSAASVARPSCHLIQLADGVRIPPAVVRITGITNDMLRPAAMPAADAWRALVGAAARLPLQPAPAVIHFARFEQPFLAAMHARHAGAPAADAEAPGEDAGLAEGFPFDVVCTHTIAKRLLPDLPRCSLRALAGYLGCAVGPLRRAGDHVNATAFVWRELVPLLREQGIDTWGALHAWTREARSSSPRRSQPLPQQPPIARGLIATGRKPPRRVWPMPRSLRLALPDAPGIYRMLRINGDVLYVGKATALHHRVNSYFRKQQHIPERLLEMLSQARGLSYEVIPTALEAALVEADEIKRHRPPYNIALTTDRREVWFAASNLVTWGPCVSEQCPLGPLVSADTLQRFNALSQGDRTALTTGRWGPEPGIFVDGLARFHAAHAEVADRNGTSSRAHDRLLALGTRLWREGRRDRDEREESVDGGPEASDASDTSDASRGRAGARPAWTPEFVQLSLEWIVIRAALERRRAIWLTRLADATLQWCEPGAPTTRLLVIEAGDIVRRETLAAGTELPPPPGWRRPTPARRALFGLACFDRLRVLTTEMKRLVTAGAPVSLRLGAGPALSGARLAAALWWV